MLPQKLKSLAANYKKYFIVLLGTFSFLGFFVGLLSLFEMLSLGLFSILFVLVFKSKNMTFETNAIIKNLDFKIARMHSSLREMERSKSRNFVRSSNVNLNVLDQKRLFQKLHKKFPLREGLRSSNLQKSVSEKGFENLLLDQKKSSEVLSKELNSLRNLQESIESQILVKEKIFLSKKDLGFDLKFNVTSIAKWQIYLDSDERTSLEISGAIKFFCVSPLFKGEVLKNLLTKAIRSLSLKEDNLEIFLNHVDSILERFSHVMTAYYACQKIMDSKAGFSYEKYLSILCQGNDELNEAQKNRLSFILGEIKIQNMDLSSKKYLCKSHYKKNEKTIFYVLHNSEPYMTFGYASRARGVMKSLQKGGYEVYGVTRLGFPTDRYDLKESLPMLSDLPLEDNIGGLTYLRLLPRDQKGLFEKALDIYCEEAKEEIIRLAYLKKPSLIMAASNFYTAFPALLAARELGIPFVYEVRGFWEVTRYSRDPFWKNSYAHRFYETMENKISLAADKVVTLTSSMKDLIETRSSGKVTVNLVPNAMTPPSYVYEEKDKELLKSLSISDEEKVIGFIGSVVPYEGLNLVVEAAAYFKSKPVKFLIVGAGSALEALKSYADELQVSDRFVFTGRVSHKEVAKYYSLIDLVVLPRLALPVCELVSPLKPFEAMAHKKLVLMSNVAAMKEFTVPGVNGFLFEKENIDSFVKEITKLIFSGESFDEEKLMARDWAHQNRTWDQVSSKLLTILKDLS